jgi:hypothetical protein
LIGQSERLAGLDMKRWRRGVALSLAAGALLCGCGGSGFSVSSPSGASEDGNGDVPREAADDETAFPDSSDVALRASDATDAGTEVEPLVEAEAAPRPPDQATEDASVEDSLPVLDSTNGQDSAETSPAMPEAASSEEAASLPTSCTGLGDGKSQLQTQGMTWSATCIGGATYLDVDPLLNVSEYVPGGGPATGTTVQTRYSKVRIVPELPAIDLSDTSYSMSIGKIMQGGADVETIVGPLTLGFAATCDGAASAVATVDVAPFTISTSEFSPNGSGSGSVMATGDLLNIKGGGFCGWMGPTVLTDYLHPSGILPINP